MSTSFSRAEYTCVSYCAWALAIVMQVSMLSPRGEQGVSQDFKSGRPKEFCGRGHKFLLAWPQFFVVVELWCFIR